LSVAPPCTEESEGCPAAGRGRPLVTAVEMGYGHLRAARALAAAIGDEVLLADRPPLVAADEERLWRISRRFYEITSRASQLPWVGSLFGPLLESVTAIPHLHPQRDLSAPSFQARSLDRLVRKGLCRGLVERVRATGRPLVSTFFTPALAADRSTDLPVYCVVTDVDVSRAWVPLEPRRTRIVYLTPTRRAVHRLAAYGVPEAQIEFTGFPLPDELLGGPELPALEQNLAARLARLDRKGIFREQTRREIRHFLPQAPGTGDLLPPLLTFTVGGAGAQAGIARPLLRALAPLLDEGRLRLCLVAGVRREIAVQFERWAGEAGCGRHLGGALTVLFAESLADYFPRFNALLADTDVLWTKPSEMTFYGALGLPLILAPPVGVHEHYNRRWAIENGVGLKQRDPRHAGYWLREWLNEGTLAAAAWSGFVRLPKFGLYQILDRLRRDGALAAGPAA
jgi:UDP-N-acetylglucosamine:LPS N-acetylglucosamine transferase